MRVEIPNTIAVTLHGLVSRGVKAAEVTDEGHLVLTLTDGSRADLGSVLGPQGARGEQGLPGPKGETGPQGPAGATPVKGTDYFTEADKQELAAAAAAQVSVPVSSVDGQTGAVSLAGTYATPADLTARLNRSTDVHAADTAYTTYMARGEALFAQETTPTVNGAIAWQYE